MTIPDRTAVDALAYIARIVEDRIDFAIDAISSGLPSTKRLYSVDEYALDTLFDLTVEVLAVARPHGKVAMS